MFFDVSRIRKVQLLCWEAIFKLALTLFLNTTLSMFLMFYAVNFRKISTSTQNLILKAKEGDLEELFSFPLFSLNFGKSDQNRNRIITLDFIINLLQEGTH